MEVRALEVEDAPSAARVFASARAVALPWLPVLHSPEQDVAFFTGQLRTGTGLGIDGPHGLLGFAVVRPGWLDHLYVEPEARGQGIGSELLAAARQAAPGDMQLWTFARNVDALAFYRRRGAIEVERTDGTGNEEREPDVRLVLPGLAPASAP